ncbi:MAG: dihydrodipicolinate synthase family protein [Melioribacteraceae bacterium]|nr:dihydrodipicolinate synthase family protein [Melioribacteraceae bacterium]
MKKQKKYSGIVIPMLTPFTKDGRIDLEAVERIIDNFISYKVYPFILGTTGEAASISSMEKSRIAEFIGKKYSGKTTIYVGISSNCVEETIESAKEYVDLGADVLVANLPSYYPLKPDQMQRYFEHLASSVSKPLILYNITATTHMSIPLDVVEKLSHHPNIVALKDSERDLVRLDTAIEMFKDREDFSYLIGWAAKSFYGLSKGSDGLVPSTGNMTPGMFKKMYDSVLEGNLEIAERMQKETDMLASIYQSDKTLGESLAAAKIIMEEFGLCKNFVLSPLTPLNKITVQEIISKLNDLKEKVELY